MIEDCTAIILAGGDSRRMGRDKASLLLGEQTLVEHVIAAMQSVFAAVIVSVRQPRPGIDLPQVCDDPAVAGPLAGLTAGLGQIRTPWAFVVACDMPFMQAEMIEKLGRYRENYQAVVPVVQGHVQPLAAFYARSSLAVIRAHLASGGKNSLRAVLDKMPVRYVAESELFGAGDARRSFFDLDTPQDVATAIRDGVAHSKR